LIGRDDLTPEAKEDLRENLQARYATEEARLDTKPSNWRNWRASTPSSSSWVILARARRRSLRYLALRSRPSLA